VPATNRVAYAATSPGRIARNTFAVGWQRLSDGLPAGGVRKVFAAENGLAGSGGFRRARRPLVADRISA